MTVGVLLEGQEGTNEFLFRDVDTETEEGGVRSQETGVRRLGRGVWGARGENNGLAAMRREERLVLKHHIHRHKIMVILLGVIGRQFGK